jgi:hypothetical protein
MQFYFVLFVAWCLAPSIAATSDYSNSSIGANASPGFSFGPYSSFLTIPAPADAYNYFEDDTTSLLPKNAPVVHSEARIDNSLFAVVTKCRDMYYTVRSSVPFAVPSSLSKYFALCGVYIALILLQGLGDRYADRPGYVRAASSLVWGGRDQMAVIQDVCALVLESNC